MMKNNKFRLSKYSVLFVLFFLVCCTSNTNDKSNIGNIVELSGDGCWGYAGRFAHIANDTLFFSYLDKEGCDWAASYSFASGEITRNNIWKGDSDLHSANPLFIRPDGRVQVFIDRGSYSDGGISWKVSDKPFSVNGFGELQHSQIKGDILQGRQFYPMVHNATGEVYLVVNAIEGDLREAVMWKSPDGGDTWTEYKRLWGLGKGLADGRCYTRTFMQGDDIHFVTLRVGWDEALAGNRIGMVEGVYYIRYNVVDGSFFHANGERSFGIGDTPLYETKYFDEIWNWEKDGGKNHRALWSDIVADENGNPYVTFAVMKSVPLGEPALHDGYWATPNRDGEWGFHKVAQLAKGWDNKPERKNYAIAIDPEDPETVYVAMRAPEGEGLSRIHRMHTRDGGKTWQSSAILSGGGRLSTVVIPQVLDKSDRKVDVLWLDGKMDGWGDYGTKVMTVLNNTIK